MNYYLTLTIKNVGLVDDECGTKNEHKWLVGTVNCFSGWNSLHMKSNCPILRAQGRENKQAQASGSNDDAPKKNHF